MLTKIKMYTSGINHTYNGCYYEVMSMRDILCLWQGWDEPIEAYYRRFEAAISTYKIEKFTATTHMKLNKTYAVGKDDNVTKRFQDMCLILSADCELYSGTWFYLNNITLLVTENDPNTPTSAYDVLSRYKKLTPQWQSHTSPRAVTLVQSNNANRSKVVSGNYGRSFVDVMCCRWQEMEHYAGNCRSSTVNTCAGSQSLQFVLIMKKQQPAFQKLTSPIPIGYCWKNAPMSALSGK